MSDEPCHVADQFCLAAANFSQRPRLITRCVKCGYAVCRNCSLRTVHMGRRARLCHDCYIEEHGASGQGRVMAHLTILADGEKQTCRRPRPFGVVPEWRHREAVV